MSIRHILLSLVQDKKNIRISEGLSVLARRGKFENYTASVTWIKHFWSSFKCLCEINVSLLSDRSICCFETHLSITVCTCTLVSTCMPSNDFKKPLYSSAFVTTQNVVRSCVCAHVPSLVHVHSLLSCAYERVQL